VESALGVEINPEAVERANRTAQTLGLTHLRFQASDASQVKSELEKMKADLILVNPPRRGIGESLSLIRESKARYLIYSSCQAETLAKDLLDLKDVFEVERVQLFDMFPHTEHYETLVLLKSIVADKT
jgi:23S rRNA (uracil747-C5)-methyltransferase